MKNTDELLKKILLNMKYDPKMSLNENHNLILFEQTSNVGEYSVTNEKDYKRIRVNTPSGKTYYWSPSGKWFKDLGNEQFVDLNPSKNSKLISVLTNVFKKSGIGSTLYLKNETQGDKFRQWVIKKDPKFAESIDLSETGPYNNEYIFKAWTKYGTPYKEFLKSNKPLTSNDKDTQRVIESLTSKGFDPSGAKSMNEAYALSAVRATKKLTDLVSSKIFGAFDSPYFVCVEKVGSTCSPGSYLIVDTFNMDMAKKINSRTDKNSQGLKPPQYTLLTNFYFDYGKIMADLQNTFKDDKNAYKSELFPDGWWNWFITYWGTDNLTEIKMASSPKTIKVPGGGKGYPSGKLTTSDTHTFLSVVEIGTLLLGLIPSPLSPLLLGVSTAAGLADAGTYFYEGDKYMGSMMLALEVIPGGDFIQAFKQVGRYSKISKLGKEGTQSIIEKGVKKEFKNEAEQKLYNDVVSELKNGGDKIIANQVEQTIFNNLTTGLVKTFKQLGGNINEFFKIVKLFWNTMGFVPKMVFNIGGTMWSVDQLYLALYGRDEDRQNSDIRKLYYLIKGGSLPEKNSMDKNVEKMGQMVTDPKEVNKFMSGGLEIGEDDKGEGLRNFLAERNKQQIKSEKNKINQPTLKTPPIKSIVDGKSFITYGMSGPEITQIKSILQSNWYGDIDNDKLQKTLTNNVFDNNFYEIVSDFQLNIIPKYFKSKINPAEIGMIGKDTYNYLNQIATPKLQTKKADPYYLSKDKYNFYYYSLAQKKWVNIDYEKYVRYKENGIKVSATPKEGINK